MCSVIIVRDLDTNALLSCRCAFLIHACLEAYLQSSMSFLLRLAEPRPSGGLNRVICTLPGYPLAQDLRAELERRSLAYDSMASELAAARAASADLADAEEVAQARPIASSTSLYVFIRSHAP